MTKQTLEPISLTFFSGGYTTMEYMMNNICLSFTQPTTHSLIHLTNNPTNHSLIHSLSRFLTHSLTQLTKPLNHSPNQ